MRKPAGLLQLSDHGWWYPGTAVWLQQGLNAPFFNRFLITIERRPMTLQARETLPSSSARFNRPSLCLMMRSLLCNMRVTSAASHRERSEGLVDTSSREAALFSRRALRQRENKVGLRTWRPVIWEPSTEQQRACEVVA